MYVYTWCSICVWPECGYRAWNGVWAEEFGVYMLLCVTFMLCLYVGVELILALYFSDPLSGALKDDLHASYT